MEKQLARAGERLGELLRETTIPTANKMVHDMIAALWLPAYARVLEIDYMGSGSVRSASLDCCFAVNTLYFWRDPADQFAAIHSALKPGGTFILAFVQKEYGGHLPWTLFDFKFYTIAEVTAFFERIGFLDIEVQHRTEGMLDTKGDHIVRPFLIVSGHKA